MIQAPQAQFLPLMKSHSSRVASGQHTLEKQNLPYSYLAHHSKRLREDRLLEQHTHVEGAKIARLLPLRAFKLLARHLDLNAHSLCWCCAEGQQVRWCWAALPGL